MKKYYLFALLLFFIILIIDISFDLFEKNVRKILMYIVLLFNFFTLLYYINYKK